MVSKDQEIAVANAYYDLEALAAIVDDMDEGNKPDGELRLLNKMGARTMTMLRNAFPTVVLAKKTGGN